MLLLLVKRLSNSILIQWGYSNNKGTSSYYENTFPTSFTNTSYQLTNALYIPSGGSSSIYTRPFREKSTTKYKVFTGGDTYTIMYIAIGY